MLIIVVSIVVQYITKVVSVMDIVVSIVVEYITKDVWEYLPNE